ncbi:hypothetical protein GCM10009555_026610 [Acrocarpospora macrocephala]|uniref:Cell division protein FtsL n=1 Tax=Acrocarpospora macrocephala TaxID=150177 RepID=A0A5M3WQM8_9ACTN|nr:hypothetical protein [Acrocarpospora macrocephala]GES10776.1 hypothetical protein Amac_043730 [Acrocarpospora macrocephala]
MTTDQDNRRAGTDVRTRARVPGRTVPAPKQAPKPLPTQVPGPVPKQAPKPEPKAPQPAKPQATPKAPQPRLRAQRQEPVAAKPVPKPMAARPGDRRPPRAPFVLLVVGLLGGGLVSLLLLNTVLAQDSFKYNELRRVTEQLHQQANQEEGRIRDAQQPSGLAGQAGDLGLRPDDSAPEFVGEGLHPASLGERVAEPGDESAAPRPAATTEGAVR